MIHAQPLVSRLRERLRHRQGHNAEQQHEPCEPIRIGVFYDGVWFRRVYDYFAFHHPLQARINLGGLHDAIRWYAHSVFATPLDGTVIAQAHHFQARSRPQARSFNWVLDRHKIVRHQLPATQHKEIGVDVDLALTAYEATRDTPLDMVALLTGDGDFTPLATRLTEQGVRVLVPNIQFNSTSSITAPPGSWVSGHLIKAATDTPAWIDVLCGALDDAYPLTPPFLPPPPTSTHDEKVPDGTPR